MMASYIRNKSIDYVCISVLILTVVQVLNINSVQGQTCPTTGHTTPGMPTLPDLPNVFKIDVEIKQYERATTMDATIYYDSEGNQASVTVFQNGQQENYIYSYKTSELFSIVDTNCTVRHINRSVNENYVYNLPNPVFLFGNASAVVYIGRNTSRGIPTNQWRSCPKAQGFSSLTVDTYYSVNWTTASTFPYVPVRREVRGVQLLTNGTSINIHHVFEFFNYLPGDSGDGATNIFQVPKLTVCPGRINTKTMPSLPTKFYFRTEKIIEDLQAIMFEDTWYDHDLGLYRHDYKSLAPEYPQYTTNPLTEIHDFNTGVRYVIDRSHGNCSTYPLAGYTPDVGFTVTKYSNTSILNMANPLQLLYLDWNYTYIGQFQIRGLMCDAFTAQRNDVYINDFVSGEPITATVYFLTKEWTSVTDSANKPQITSVPVMMELLATQSLFTATFNFLDFDSESPSLDTFDIGRCYSPEDKTTFQIKFPGPYQQGSGEMIKELTHLKLAMTFGVSLQRISTLQLSYDPSNIFITASLLNKTIPFSQFTYNFGDAALSSSWTVVDGVLAPEQCADFCVNHANFTCAMFKMCGSTCSITQEMLQILPTNQSMCDVYSRNVKPFPAETSMSEAFGRLKKSVYNSTFKLQDVAGTKVYTAADVKLLFGRMNPAVTIPKLGETFSCRIETTFPSANEVLSSQIWYDGAYKVLRYDAHSRNVNPPYNTLNPMTIVEDYGTGVKYIIDKNVQNCTRTHISTSDLGSLPTNSSLNDHWRVVMENPLKLFHIDDSYTFVGQQTIRGMLCNVFESLRTDFHTPIIKGDVDTVFRFAFLADQWSELSDGYIGANGQPVRLEITVLTEPFYTEINIYDYDSGHPDLGAFAIEPCFSDQQMKHIQVRFPGKYLPVLATTSKLFRIEAFFKISTVANLSPLRLQRLYLDYDDNNIYLTFTLVENTDHLLYFTQVVNGSVPGKADKVLSNIATLKECADECRQSTAFECNSFYLCQNEPAQCLLSKTPGPGPNPQYSSKCSAYVKTVNSTKVPPSNLYSYIQLKNAVYSGNLSIIVPSKTFTADSIRDDILSPLGENTKATSMSEFTLKKTDLVIETAEQLLYNIAMDDCAAACVNIKDYRCLGIGYCPSNQRCYISTKRADSLLPSDVVKNVGCSIYSRNYVTDFVQSPGVIQQTAADETRPSIGTDEECARLCSTNSTCKSFEYCANTRQCLLSNSRQQTIAGPVVAPTCNLYIGVYSRDFVAINAGQYLFTSVVQLIGVNVMECSRACVLRQGDYCKGFYFSGGMSTCYLTSSKPDDGTGHVTTSLGEDSPFCDVYTRIYYPDKPVPGLVTSTASPSTSSATSSSISSSSSSSSASTTRTTQATTPSISPSSVSSISTKGRTAASPQQLFTSSTTQKHASYTQQQQHQCADTSKQSGTLAGVAVGTFFAGLILGAVLLYLYRRFRKLDRDELKTNFVHDEM